VRQSFDFAKLRFLKGYDAASFGTEQTKLVYKHWQLFENKRPNGHAAFSYYIVTNSPPDESPKTLSADLSDRCWDTTSVGQDGELEYPDGTYKIVVRTYDFAEHSAEESVVVDVRNKQHGGK
jgi:hypothetical protein